MSDLIHKDARIGIDEQYCTKFAELCAQAHAKHFSDKSLSGKGAFQEAGLLKLLQRLSSNWGSSRLSIRQCGCAESLADQVLTVNGIAFSLSSKPQLETYVKTQRLSPELEKWVEQRQLMPEQSSRDTSW
jgi:hypothetical protein